MKKYKGNGIIWDAEYNRPLLEFLDGEVITDDARTIDIMDGLGYVGEALMVSEPEVVLEDMTADELKAFAEANGIDIGRCTTKDSILAKIVEATVPA